MKSITAVILVLLLISALPAADSRCYSSNFSLASRNGPAVVATVSSVRVGSALAQSGSERDAGRGYLHAMPTPTVKKASGTTLLIIGTALFAGGWVIVDASESDNATAVGLILVVVGGITIYKGIQVLISSGRDRYLARSHGSLQIAIRASF